jgi:glycosyltransferase involved in cell wall biosynthesis
MRIAGFIRLWHSHRGVGGMQAHALSLYSGLVKAGHSVDVFTTCHPHKGTMEVDHGICVHYIQDCEPATYSDQFFDNSKIEFSRLHHANPFDVIHSESSCARHFTNQEVPVVATWHGVSYCGLRSIMNLAALDNDKQKYIERIQKSAAAVINEIPEFITYDHHIAISHQAYDDLLKIYHLPSKKVSLVFNGSDTSLFNIDENKRALIRARYNIPDTCTVLGIAGRLEHDKGHWLFISILPWLLEDPNIYVLIVGDGFYTKGYQKLNNARIIFAGPQPYSEMPAYYNSFDIFVNPTTRHIGLDLTIQEAMLCGVPVIASDVGSIKRSLLKNKALGRVFKLSDPVDFGTQLFWMLKRLKKTDRRYIRNYVVNLCAVETMCYETLKVFEKAIEDRNV